MTEKQKELICTIAGVQEIGELSDGYHTFNSLYKQRMILFAALVKLNKAIAWKSWKHEDGELCFGGGWFIVGIDTPAGSYTYHYEAKDWGKFECMALDVAKHWDGHTDADVERLLSLKDEWELLEQKSAWSEEDEKIRKELIDYHRSMAAVADDYVHEAWIDWLKSLKKRMEEQQ